MQMVFRKNGSEKMKISKKESPSIAGQAFVKLNVKVESLIIFKKPDRILVAHFRGFAQQFHSLLLVLFDA